MVFKMMKLEATNGDMIKLEKWGLFLSKSFCQTIYKRGHKFGFEIVTHLAFNHPHCDVQCYYLKLDSL